jgi:Kef-type K+ transport system membrane component KefB
MMRLLALTIILVIAALVTSVEPGGPIGVRGAGLAIGFALIAAALTGELFAKIRLPRISGYLLFGIVAGPYAGAILTPAMALELQVVNGLAIALIAFIACLEINFHRLRPQLRAVLTMGGVMLGLMWVGLTLVFFLAWPYIPILPELTGVARLALAGLLATVTTSFSPTVSIAVIAESRARGPVCELVLALVVLADLMLILLFTLSMESVRLALGEGTAGPGSGLLSNLAWEIFGSFAFGGIVGALFAFYLRYVGREVTVMLLAVSAILSQVGAVWHFEPLLAALAAGLVVENIAPPEGDALRIAVERGALPVLVLFFAAAGANLHLDALASLGLIAVAIAVVRGVFIRGASAAGAQVAGLHGRPPNLAWMGLISQAGVTLGLAIIVASEFPEWGVRLQTLVVALITIHEMVGPILFRAALLKAGEVGQMDVGEPAHGHQPAPAPV